MNMRIFLQNSFTSQNKTFQLILNKFEGFQDVIRVLYLPRSSKCLTSEYYLLIHRMQPKLHNGYANFSSKLDYSQFTSQIKTFQLNWSNFGGFQEVSRVLYLRTKSKCLTSQYNMQIQRKQPNIHKGYAYFSSKLVYSYFKNQNVTVQLILSNFQRFSITFKSSTLFNKF